MRLPLPLLNNALKGEPSVCKGLVVGVSACGVTSPGLLSMLQGINDTDDDARRIVQLTAGIPCKLNLVRFNPHDGAEFFPSSLERVLAFRDVLAREVRVPPRTYIDGRGCYTSATLQR